MFTNMTCSTIEGSSSSQRSTIPAGRDVNPKIPRGHTYPSGAHFAGRGDQVRHVDQPLTPGPEAVTTRGRAPDAPQASACGCSGLLCGKQPSPPAARPCPEQASPREAERDLPDERREGDVDGRTG